MYFNVLYVTQPLRIASLGLDASCLKKKYETTKHTAKHKELATVLASPQKLFYMEQFWKGGGKHFKSSLSQRFLFLVVSCAAN